MLENILSGLLSVLVTVSVSYFVFKTRYNFDKELHHCNIAIEKLNKIIGPLVFYLEMNQSTFISTNDDMMKCIEANGYMLTPDLYGVLIEIINSENNSNQLTEEDEELKLARYEELRKEFNLRLKKEQSQLVRLSTKNFEKYRELSLNPKFIKIIGIFESMCVNMFLVSLFVIWFVFAYINIADSKVFEFNELLNVTAGLMGGSFIVCSLMGLMLVITYIFKPFMKNIAESKGRFSSNAIAQKTGNYKCRVCSKEKLHYQGNWFSYCNHEGSKNIFKVVYIENYWEITS